VAPVNCCRGRTLAYLVDHRPHRPAGGNVTALAIHGAGRIFAATFAGGAFRSTDNGDSWAQHNTGVPSATFLSLAINAGGYIFAGGDPLGGRVGVICSTDNGGTWQPVNNGLTTGNGINALIATVNG